MFYSAFLPLNTRYEALMDPLRLHCGAITRILPTLSGLSKLDTNFMVHGRWPILTLGAIYRFIDPNRSTRIQKPGWIQDSCNAVYVKNRVGSNYKIGQQLLRPGSVEKDVYTTLNASVVYCTTHQVLLAASRTVCSGEVLLVRLYEHRRLERH